MTVLVAVFKSKTEVFAFLKELRSIGVSARTTGTPKEARIGCGLAVRFSSSAFDNAKRIIHYGRYNSFYGIFAINASLQKSTAYRVL